MPGCLNVEMNEVVTGDPSLRNGWSGRARNHSRSGRRMNNVSRRADFQAGLERTGRLASQPEQCRLSWELFLPAIVIRILSNSRTATSVSAVVGITVNHYSAVR